MLRGGSQERCAFRLLLQKFSSMVPTLKFDLKILNTAPAAMTLSSPALPTPLPQLTPLLTYYSLYHLSFFSLACSFTYVDTWCVGWIVRSHLSRVSASKQQTTTTTYPCLRKPLKMTHPWKSSTTILVNNLGYFPSLRNTGVSYSSMIKPKVNTDTIPL